MSLTAAPPGGPLHGRLRPPGDKSISHRALILAGLAAGQSSVRGLLRSADTLATWRAMEQLGARLSDDDGVVHIEGVGGAGLHKPSAVLDMGNSGTAMRLLAGVLAAQPFDSVLAGDESLSRRPMRRIITPLREMGARIEPAQGSTPPLSVLASDGLHGVHYASPVASAQVKSCVLLAGLYAVGRSSVTEPRASRDHTERMLPLFGVVVDDCSVQGGSKLKAADIEVPADPSSAAFLAAAALLVPGSELVLTGVGLNPTRTAFFDALRMMGATLELQVNDGAGEPAGNITVRYSGRLQGIDLPAEKVPAMIDEIPILLALAASAEGVTRIRGAAELRVKESDRLAVMGAGLRRMGIEVTDYPDGIDILGGMPTAANLDAADDHRCAMSFVVLGQAVTDGVRIDGADYIDTSYPGFASDLRQLGGRIGRLAGGEND